MFRPKNFDSIIDQQNGCVKMKCISIYFRTLYLLLLRITQILTPQFYSLRHYWLEKDSHLLLLGHKLCRKSPDEFIQPQ